MRREGYILAYDIRAPKRLRRVHRYMLRWGVAVQYSVFSVRVGPDEVEEMMAGLKKLADPEDDIRLYRVPDRGGMWLGRDLRPEGVVLAGKRAPGNELRGKARKS